MRLLISCQEGGSLKEAVCAVGTDSSVQNAEQPLKVDPIFSDGADNCVDIMHVSGDNLLLGRHNGLLELLELEGYQSLDHISNLLDDARMEPFYSRSKKRVKLKDCFVAFQPLRDNHFFLATKSGLIHILKIEDNRQLLKIQTLEVIGPLDFAQVCDNWGKQHGKYVFGYGGEENQIKLVEMEADFSKLRQIWEAKNVKNDRLDMRVPVWPTAMKFLQPSSTGSTVDDKVNYQFIVITHWSYLGHYNTQHGRRPLTYKQLFKNREALEHLEVVSPLSTSLGNVATDQFRDFAIITTDTKRNVYKYDINGRLLSKIGRGDISGAASFVKVVEPGCLLEGGLDKYARIYDVCSGERLIKVYAGASIKYITLLDAARAVPSENQYVASKRKPVENREGEEDADELWKELDEKNSKRQKK
ncbi:BN860_12486g1_1 [Zygosaccharomyces bailii CLIB 213]|uniref:Ribosome biogenesis protein NSA1 n=1 Tax=Zygosaccharomyces bailii (strain CLIB 213 / ATCC 58445 / CBS 680 / BCRC 21525 / NBRC 1098 / NCYC 1416 / NRRL Y-2227) TaxID=1333698 RepID=A0A8J2T598_ZYGB2|nr:BN860_12486g1_1 [Zygosaccharomyces bailii CLIB 213]